MRIGRAAAAVGGLGVAAMAGCLATVPITPSPAAAAPFSLSATDVMLLYWIGVYGDSVRLIFGASVNALGNQQTTPGFPPLPSQSDFNAEWKALGSEQQACTACTEAALSCAGPNNSSAGLQLDAHSLALSTYALRSHTPTEAEVPPAGGATCGQLLRRSCDACVDQAAALATSDGGIPSDAGPPRG